MENLGDLGDQVKDDLTVWPRPARRAQRLDAGQADGIAFQAWIAIFN